MTAWENYHLEWSSDPLSVTNPTWQDITAYALNPGERQSPITIQGGVPTSGGSAQYATMAVSLDDTDHRFLFGSSSCLSGWKPGRRIRCYETIGSRRVDLFSGFIAEPETTDYAERGVSQHMMVTAYDRLGWLSTSRQLISTCTEYIRYQGGSNLKAYWPLNDPSGSTTARQVASSGTEAQLSIEDTTLSSLISFGSVSPPAGDDANFLRLTPALLDASEYLPRLTNLALTPIAATQVITVAGWANVSSTSSLPLAVFRLTDAAGVNFVSIYLIAGNWQATIHNGAGQVDLTGPAARANTWDYMACQVNGTTGACELWVNNARLTGTLPGASTGTMDRFYLGAADDTGQGVGHAQIYAGDSASFTRTQFLAQQSMALNGLNNQFTGERISTLATWGGVPTTELGLIDRGTSVMQRASIAGQYPLSGMRLAETTEQGRLRTNGQGLIVFEPRTKRYNS